MKLIQKILLINTLTLISIISVIYLFSESLFLNDYQKLEDQAIQRNNDRFWSSLESEFTNLSIINSDWASWDDTYLYMQDFNPIYIESNFVDGTFISLKLNYLILLDVEGNLVYSRGYDLQEFEDIPLTFDLLSQIQPGSMLATHPDPASHVNGLISIDEKILMVDSKPILTSDDEGPVMGALIMARFFDTTILSQLSQNTQLSINSNPINEMDLPEFVKTPLFTQEDNQPTYVQKVDEAKIISYFLLRDIYRNPLVILSSTEPRQIYLQGKASVTHILQVLGFATFASSLMMFIAFDRLIFRRLFSLITYVSRVSKDQRTNMRIPLEGKDEFTSLVSNLNKMLKNLDDSQTQIRQSEELYRTVVEGQTELIFHVAVDGTINFVNNAYCQYYRKRKDQIVGKKFSTVFSKRPWQVFEERIKQLSPQKPIIVVEEQDLTQKDRGVWQQWINKGIFSNRNKLVEVQSVGRDITERKLVELELENRLKFERSMIEISTRLINLRLEQVNEGINHALKKIGELASVDRSYVFLFRKDDPTVMDNTHEWCAQGIKSCISQLQGISLDELPWFYTQIQKLKTIYIPCVSSLPTEASAEKDHFMRQSIQSLLCVPMLMAGHLIGFVGFDSVKQERTWSEEILILLESAANAIANVLDHMQFEQKNQIREKHLIYLNEISQTAIEGENIQSFLQQLAHKLCALVDADNAYIAIPGDGKENLFIAHSQMKNQQLKIKYALGFNNFKQLLEINHGEDIIKLENQAQGSLHLQKIAERLHAKAFISLPLSVKNRVVGMTCLTYNNNHRFSPQEIETLQRSAKLLSLAILKIRALEIAQRQAAELDVLRANIIDISSELDLSKLLQVILNRSIELLHATGGDLCLYDPKKKILEVVACEKMKKRHIGTIVNPNEGAAGKVMLSNQPLFITDYQTWQGRSPRFSEPFIHCSISAPMLVGKKLTGVISLFHSNPTFKFQTTDLNLLVLFAQQAAIAVENARLFQEVERLARTDNLTNLYNRFAWEEMVNYEINRAQRVKWKISMIMLDFDDFKLINDKYTHAIGDQVLHELAEIVHRNVRNVDIVGRYGGDEMIIIMPDTDSTEALRVAERLRVEIESSSIPTEIGSVSLTASLGVTTAIDGKLNIQEMQNLADQALHQAKKAGRNCVRVLNKT